MIITNLQLPVGKAMNIILFIAFPSICDVGQEECLLCTVYWSCVLFLMNSWWNGGASQKAFTHSATCRPYVLAVQWYSDATGHVHIQSTGM